MKPRLVVIDGHRGPESDPRPATGTWNRVWRRGEHGGDTFTTATAHVDVVNPRLVSGIRVFVGGSRTATDRDAIGRALSQLPRDAVVLTSRTFGAAAAARNAAQGRGLQMEVWTARLDQFPTCEAAYFARDEEMIRSADRVIAFWDGCSLGTAHELDYARRIGKPVEVVSAFAPPAGELDPGRQPLPLPLNRHGDRRPQPPDPWPGGDAA